MTTVDSSSITHVCPKCGTEKPLTLEFFFKQKRKTGYFWSLSRCLECRRSEDRINISKPHVKQKRALSIKIWKINNPDKLNEQRYREGIAKAEKAGRLYATQCIKKFINSSGFNARKNLKEFLANSSDEEMACWYAAIGKPWLNPRITSAEVFKIRYRLDSEFNTYQKMRRQLKKDLYGDGIADDIRSSLLRNGKSKKVEQLLGYTIEELHIHLERQFTKGMTWDKFMNGEIHIDHILPKKSFDLNSHDEWKSCWSLPNLRPMWAKDNRAKSAKILTLL